ncbi:class I adenylate-forming enzyme family protein [Cyanobium sp. CH-040]|uniref:AMP-binding enzyme n=1 Tax=Cyanobium sp. CH-040 TaxID=2823708 RepID=UPI0020CC48F2|nr:class I adenylate-forming enzyme family protein [Cyanobium sp. CH-040]MCP9928330.1 acyl--CoA ligase [Cyanobium sp. CH-040]
MARSHGPPHLATVLPDLLITAIAQASLDWAGHVWEPGRFATRALEFRRTLQEWLPEAGSGGQPVRLGILAGEHIHHLAALVGVLLGGWTQALVPLGITSSERCTLRRRYGLTHLLSDHPGGGGWADAIPLGEPLAGWQLHALPPLQASPSAIHADALFLSLSSGTSSGQGSLNCRTAADLLWSLQGVDWSPYRLLQRPLLGTSMQYANARMFKLFHLLQGHHLILRDFDDPFRPEHFEAGAQSCTFDPGALRSCLRLGQLQRCPADFLCVVGADHVPMDLRRAVADLGRPRVGVVYATSQTGPLTWLPPEELLDEPESLGRPLANVVLEPIDDTAPLLRDGLEFREMRVRKTWHIRPPGQPGAAPVPVKVVEGFNPNDLLARSPSGQIIFGGRANDVFLFRSLLVSPLEIEEVLRAQPEVLDCAGFGAPSPHYGAVPMAAVVLRPGVDPQETSDRLRRLAREQLGVRSPKKIVVLPDDLPRGPTGKPLRRVLADAHRLG